VDGFGKSPAAKGSILPKHEEMAPIAKESAVAVAPVMSSSVAESFPVLMTGSVVRGSSVIVTLSDGRRLRGEDLAVVTEDKAVGKDGRVYWRAPIVLRMPNPSGGVLKGGSRP